MQPIRLFSNFHADSRQAVPPKSQGTAPLFAGESERRNAIAKTRTQPSEASIWLSQFYGKSDANEPVVDQLSLSGHGKALAEKLKTAKAAKGQPAHGNALRFAADKSKPGIQEAQLPRFLKLMAEPSEALAQAQKLNEALQQRVHELELQVSNLKNRGVFSRLFNLSK